MKPKQKNKIVIEGWAVTCLNGLWYLHAKEGKWISPAVFRKQKYAKEALKKFTGGQDEFSAVVKCKISYEAKKIYRKA